MPYCEQSADRAASTADSKPCCVTSNSEILLHRFSKGCLWLTVSCLRDVIFEQSMLRVSGLSQKAGTERKGSEPQMGMPDCDCTQLFVRSVTKQPNFIGKPVVIRWFCPESCRLGGCGCDDPAECGAGRGLS